MLILLRKNRMVQALTLGMMLCLVRVTPLFFPHIVLPEFWHHSFRVPVSPWHHISHPMIPVAHAADLRHNSQSALLDPNSFIVIKPASEINGASLHSNTRSYTCAFTGEVRSQDQPCSGCEVHVMIQTSDDHAAEAETMTRPNGTYELHMSFLSLPDEMATWSLTARGSEDRIAEMGGRSILTEDNNLAIDKAVDLP